MVTAKCFGLNNQHDLRQ